MADNDQTVEKDMVGLLGDRVAVYVSRLHEDDECNPQALYDMKNRIIESASLILPGL